MGALDAGRSSNFSMTVSVSGPVTEGGRPWQAPVRPSSRDADHVMSWTPCGWTSPDFTKAQRFSRSPGRRTKQ